MSGTAHRRTAAARGLLVFIYFCHDLLYEETIELVDRVRVGGVGVRVHDVCGPLCGGSRISYEIDYSHKGVHVRTAANSQLALQG